MSALASAQVFVEYWPVGDTPDGVNNEIEADISGGDVSMTLNIGLTAPGSDGLLLLPAGDFNFTWPSGFSMTDFLWDEGNFPTVPAQGWIADSSLPAPSLSTFMAPFLLPMIPTGPATQLMLATVDVTIDGTVLLGNHSISVGSDSDAANPTFYDAFFAPYDIQGSGSIPFRVTPEPATIVLLALGGFTALRRRRS